MFLSLPTQLSKSRSRRWRSSPRRGSKGSRQQPRRRSTIFSAPFRTCAHKWARSKFLGSHLTRILGCDTTRETDHSASAVRTIYFWLWVSPTKSRAWKSGTITSTLRVSSQSRRWRSPSQSCASGAANKSKKVLALGSMNEAPTLSADKLAVNAVLSNKTFVLSILGVHFSQTLLSLLHLLQIQLTQQSSKLDSGFWAASPSICLAVSSVRRRGSSPTNWLVQYD